MSFISSRLDKLKSKRISDATKRKLLQEVKQEAYQEEQKKVKLEAKAKQADAFLKEIEKAKKDGAEKARVGGTTYSISTLIKKGKQAQKVAKQGIKAANTGIELAKKGLDMVGEPTFYPKKSPPKKKIPLKKRITPPINKMSRSMSLEMPSKKVNRYLITDIKTGKKGTFNAKNIEIAKNKAVFVLKSSRKNLRYKTK